MTFLVLRLKDPLLPRPISRVAPARVLSSMSVLESSHGSPSDLGELPYLPPPPGFPRSLSFLCSGVFFSFLVLHEGSTSLVCYFLPPPLLKPIATLGEVPVSLDGLRFGSTSASSGHSLLPDQACTWSAALPAVFLLTLSARQPSFF